MKRLLEEAEPTLGSLTELVGSAARHQPSPFAKRLVASRIARALERGPRRLVPRPAWLGAAALLVAATAAAAGFSYFAAPSAVPEPQAAFVMPPVREPLAARSVSAPRIAPEAPAPSFEKPSERRVEKPRAGEDPSQVAEAVRALRKQGDPARAQALLDQYLRASPHGALAEDALALSIEAASARKDPRSADYARRYLARYPQGRFRGVAERALSR